MKNKNCLFFYRLRLLSFVVLFISFSFQAFAQSIPPLIENISLKDGLSQATVHKIIQDKVGRIWIGTLYGLQSYDGYDFTVYLKESATESTISGNNILDLISSPDGGVWAATQKNGLNFVSTEDHQISNYRHDATDLNSISSDRLDLGTLAMKENVLWVGTKGKGVNKLDLKKGAFEHFMHDPNNPKSISDDRVRATYFDQQGMLWIGTKNGLNRYEKETSQFIRFQNDPVREDSLQGTRIRALYEDSKNRFWVGTNTGLNKMNRALGTFEFHPIIVDEGTGGSLGVQSILEDSQGILWVGTDQGVFIYDYATKQSIPFPLEGYSGTIYSIFEDRSGVIWFGTDGAGIYKYSKRRNKFISYPSIPGNVNTLSHPNIRDVVEAQDGTLWVGTKRGGVNWVNKETGEVKVFKQDSSDNQSIASNRVESLAEGKNGLIWIGTAEGLNRFDPQSQELQRLLPFPNAKELEENWINDIYVDQDDLIWLGTDFGLSLYSQRTQVFTHYQNPTDERQKQYVMSVDGRSDGQLWIGTKAGLFIFNPIKQSFTSFPSKADHPLHQLEIKHSRLYQTKNGMLWVATTSGVYGIDESKNIYVHLTQENGLSSTPVYSLIGDQQDKLWMGTQLGLAFYDPEMNIFKAYDATDGLLNNEFNSVATLGRSGEMYFGGIEGVNSFQPDKLKDNPHPPEIILTAIKSYGKEIPLDQPLSEVKEIQLNYTDTFISFEFAALDYTFPQKNLYAYQLIGVDEDWVYSENRRFSNYTNLDGGEYVFRVKAANSDGVWNEEGISVKVIIPPPPWQTWWAYSAYVLILLGIIAGYVRVKTQAQAKDLERQKEVNEELIRLDGLKDSFLANTSHELRTPLHGIIGISESLRDDENKYTPETRQQLLHIIIQSATRLSKLVDDILDFSKIKHQDLPVHLQSIQVSPIVDIVITMCRPLIGQKELSLTNDLPLKMPWVKADEKRLQQILYNLIGNAIKFTPQGRISISATLHESFVSIHVSDTGIGISSEQQKTIFDVFVQGASDSLEYQEGTGLGLSLTKKMVELHQGSLTLESSPGKGSQFTFSLMVTEEPLKEIQLSHSVPILESQASNLSIGQELSEINDVYVENGLHILVVDDDPVNLQVLLHHLRHLNCSITTAVNGVEALEILEENKGEIHLLLLDVMMPLMNGYEVCRKIREEYQNIDLPILLLTARNQPEDLIEGFRVGANDYLNKPIHKEELLARVEAHLQMVQSIQQLEENERLHSELEKRRKVEEDLVSIQRHLIRVLDIVNVGLSSSQQVEGSLPNLQGIASTLEGMAKNLPQDTESMIQELQTLPQRLDGLRDTIETPMQEVKVRQTLVESMQLALHYWEITTHKTKAELAEESGIWKMHVDRQGTLRVRTLDKYLHLKSLPKRPHWRKVLQTGYYVLQNCPENESLQRELQQKLNSMEELLTKPS